MRAAVSSSPAPAGNRAERRAKKKQAAAAAQHGHVGQTGPVHAQTRAQGRTVLPIRRTG